MKKLITLLALIATAISVSAQSETPSDTIRRPSAGYKQFGEFMLDVDLQPVSQMPKINLLDMLGPDVSKDYRMIFQLDPRWIVTLGYAQTVYNPFGFSSFPQQMQTSTYKLGENTRLSTFGQYSIDGKRLPNTGVFPWEKNNFIGGMELKLNKNFGVRIEVRKGSNSAYPY